MKGIMFIEPMFHKVVSGEKTQTRRVINPQPDFISENFHWAKKNNGNVILPRYSVGETLYLKEPYKFSEYTDFSVDLTTKYSAAVREISWVEVELEYGIKHDGMDDIINSIYRRQEKSKDGWLNKMFMPEWCAVHLIEITGVRCERLQDISDSDCVKEGIVKIDSLSTRKCYALPESFNYAEFYTPQQAYAALIDSINGRGTWEINPFVWTYDFKLIK
jgi:hypothetical protein